jgi:hypothetical protein
MNGSLANVTVIGINDISEHFVRQFTAVGITNESEFGTRWALEFYGIRRGGTIDARNVFGFSEKY